MLSPTRVATRYLQASRTTSESRSLQAVIEGMGVADASDVVDDIHDAGHAVGTSLAKQCVARLVWSPVGEREISDGFEREGDSVWWTLTYPEAVVGKRGLFVAMNIKVMAALRRRMEAEKVVSLTRHPVFNTFLEAAVNEGAEEVLEHLTVPVETAEDVAYRASNLDVTQTQQTEDGEQEVDTSAGVKIKLAVGFEHKTETRTEIVLGKVTVWVTVKMSVRGDVSLPGDRDYNRYM